MNTFFWYITEMQKTATENPLEPTTVIPCQFPVKNTEERLCHIRVKSYFNAKNM